MFQPDYRHVLKNAYQQKDVELLKTYGLQNKDDYEYAIKEIQKTTKKEEESRNLVSNHPRANKYNSAKSTESNNNSAASDGVPVPAVDSSNVSAQGPSSSSQPNACVKWDDSTFTHGLSEMENGSPLHLLEINYMLDSLIKAFLTIAFVISPAIIYAINISLLYYISSFYFSLIFVTFFMFSPSILAIYIAISIKNNKS